MLLPTEAINENIDGTGEYEMTTWNDYISNTTLAWVLKICTVIAIVVDSA